MATIRPTYETLDGTDRRILRELQHDGRVSFVELAERVNLTKSPCQARVRRLQDQGFITGYRAVLEPKAVNQGHLVFIQVKLSQTTSKTLRAFNDAIRKTPYVLSCHMLSGGYDYLLKVRTKDMTDYRALLGEVIAGLPGVAQTSSFPVMEEVKDTEILVLDDD